MALSRRHVALLMEREGWRDGARPPCEDGAILMCMHSSGSNSTDSTMAVTRTLAGIVAINITISTTLSFFAPSVPPSPAPLSSSPLLLLLQRLLHVRGKLHSHALHCLQSVVCAASECSINVTIVDM